MVNYFENVKTAEELKAAYKGLVKQYHPDVYGEAGNDILKEIHSQLEKASKQIDLNNYPLYNDTDKEDTAEQAEMKETFAKEAMGYTNPEGYLFAMYWINRLRPANHRNALTEHNFSGWNIWTLELKKVLTGYQSAQWATFNQAIEKGYIVKKGEKGTSATLAVVSKAKDDEEKDKIFYKGYTVFNFDQFEEMDEQTKIEKQKMLTDKKAKWENKKDYKKPLKKFDSKYAVVAQATRKECKIMFKTEIQDTKEALANTLAIYAKMKELEAEYTQLNKKYNK